MSGFVLSLVCVAVPTGGDEPLQRRSDAEPMHRAVDGRHRNADAAYRKGKPLSFWIEKLRSSGDDHVQVGNELAAMGPVVVPDLMPLLRDPEPRVRGEAARVLSLLHPRDPALVPGLGRALDDDAARIWIPRALAELGRAAEPTVPRLREILTTTQDENARVSAALARLSREIPSLVPALVGLLKHEDPQVVMAAASAVYEVGPRAIPALRKLLDDPEPRVRSLAAERIGEIGNRVRSQPWASPAEIEPAVPSLVLLLGDASPRVRHTAARALANIGRGYDGAVRRLAEMLRDADPDVRRDAVFALRRLGPLAGTAAKLRELLADEDPSVREEARLALAAHGPEAAATVAELLVQLKEGTLPSPASGRSTAADPRRAAPATAIQNRWRAARALGRRGWVAEAALAELAHAEDDPEPSVRFHAAVARWRIDPKTRSPVPALAAAIGDLDPDVRVWAAHALAEADAAAAEPAIGMLVETLRTGPFPLPLAAHRGRMSPDLASPETEAPVRATARRDAAAEALARIGPAAVPGVIEALTRVAPSGFARLGLNKAQNGSAVLPAVVAIGRPAVPALVGLLKHGDGTVRERALRALRQIGSPEAVPALVAALADPDATVVWAAASAVRDIGVAAVPSLEEAMQSDDVRARRQAVSLLALGRSEAALVALRAALNDPDDVVRLVSAQALYAADSQEVAALATLTALLRAGDLGVRADAAVALLDGQTDAADEAAMSTLVECLVRARTPEERFEVGRRFPQLGPRHRPAVSPLMKALRERGGAGDPGVLIPVTKALGEIGPGARRTLPELAYLLMSPEVGVRIAALDAIGRIYPDDGQVVQALARVLRDQASEPRKCVLAAEALGSARPDAWAAAVAPLVEALRDPAAEARAAAASALGSLGPAARSGIPALQKALGDPGSGVRGAAAAALREISSDGSEDGSQR